MINQLYLKSILHYDKDTGEFTWVISRPPRGRAGSVAGYDNGSGYIKISIKGVRHYAHRLAFLWMNGEFPKEVDRIDHINQCRNDNRWCNLRVCSASQNSANVSGRMGVRHRHNKWYARYSNKHIGVYNTRDEAIKARIVAEIEATGGINPNERRDIKPCVLQKTTQKSYIFRGKNLSEWSRITGIPQPTLYHRIFKQLLPPDRALRLPL